MDITIETTSPDKLRTGVLVVGAFADGALSRRHGGHRRGVQGKAVGHPQARRPGGEGRRRAAPARPARHRRGASAAGEPREARRVRRQGVPRRPRRRGQGPRRRRGHGRGGDPRRCRGARSLARLAPGAGEPPARRRRLSLRRAAGHGDRARKGARGAHRQPPGLGQGHPGARGAPCAAAGRWPRGWPSAKDLGNLGGNVCNPAYHGPDGAGPGPGVQVRGRGARARGHGKARHGLGARGGPRLPLIRASSSSCTTAAARRRPSRSCWWARASPSIPAASRSSPAPIWTR